MRTPCFLLLFLACSVWAGADSVPPPLGPYEVSTDGDDPGPGVAIDYQAGRVTRRDGGERLLWTARLDGGLGAHREPHVLHDADRIYLSHGDGITALDGKTGKVAWHAPGPSDRLHLSGKLLLAVECGNGEEVLEQGRWLIARAAPSGAEVFKVVLPARDFDPWPTREVAGLFLVQAGGRYDAKGGAFLINRQGKVCHRFGSQVLDGKRLGDDRVFLTTRDVVRRSAGGREVWSIAFDPHDPLDGGGILDVAGGDLLCFRFGRICDSGVQVMRFDPRTGKTVWTASCATLDVSHSKYHHQASVFIDGPCVRVTSRGSSGSFAENLDLATGKRLKRQRSQPEE